MRRPILGPPFTHLARFPADDSGDNPEIPKLISMAFGGGNSPGTAPSFYMNALRQVYRAYEEHPLVRKGRTEGNNNNRSNINNNSTKNSPIPPLIINTMGWNKGLGLALMVDLLRLLSPTHVIQLDSSSATKNFPPITKKTQSNI